MMIKGIIIASLLIMASPVFAYIGPGFAGGVVTAVLGIIAAVFMLLMGVIWYPFKKLIRRLRTNQVVK